MHYQLSFTLSLCDTKHHSRPTAPLLRTIPTFNEGSLMLHSVGLDAGVGALLAAHSFPSVQTLQ